MFHVENINKRLNNFAIYVYIYMDTYISVASQFVASHLNKKARMERNQAKDTIKRIEMNST